MQQDSESTLNETDIPKQDLIIVGIGASAGGLEAFKSFFSRMSADSGMAFVLAQHLAPDHPSMLVELLSRTTSMPVCEAVNEMAVIANHVYIIPPNATLTIENLRSVSTRRQANSSGLNRLYSSWNRRRTRY